MKKLPMELRQLEYFRMAARFRSITRAASAMGVSQPNISVAVQKLEISLGITLFDRSQRQPVLTAEGENFLRRAAFALDALEDAMREIEDFKNLDKGEIKIGIPPMIGAYLFPKICPGFGRKYPRLSLCLFEEGSAAVREMLERGELDFGVVILSDIPKALDSFKVCESELMACIPRDFSLARKKSLSFRDFDGVNVIAMKEGSFIRHFLADRFAAEGITPRIALESNQIEIIKRLAENGAGAAFLLDCVTGSSPGFSVRPFKKPVRFDIGLAWKKERYLSKAASAFMEFCRDSLAEK